MTPCRLVICYRRDFINDTVQTLNPSVSMFNVQCFYSKQEGNRFWRRDLQVNSWDNRFLWRGIQAYRWVSRFLRNAGNHVSNHTALYFFFSFFWHNGPQWAMACSFTRFLHHTQRRTTVGRTPLDGWSTRRRDLYRTTHNTHNRHPCHRLDSNPQSQQACGRRLRPRDHWDWQCHTYSTKILRINELQSVSDSGTRSKGIAWYRLYCVKS